MRRAPAVSALKAALQPRVLSQQTLGDADRLLGDLDREFEATVGRRQIRIVDVGHGDLWRMGAGAGHDPSAMAGLWLRVQSRNRTG